MITAAGVSAGAQLLGAVGGLFGKSKSPNKAMAMQFALNEQARMNKEAEWYRTVKAHEDYWNTEQLKFAKDQFAHQINKDTHGIRMRVQDAKAAGLHPLYALGGGVQGGSPVTFAPGGISPTGSAAGVGLAYGSDRRISSRVGDVGRAIAGILAQREASQQQEKENARAERESKAKTKMWEAEAALAHSRIKRAEQAAQSQGRDVQTFGLGPDSGPVVTYEPNKRGFIGERTLHGPGGGAWSVGRGSRVEDWEQEYGDLASSLYGAGKMSWDALRNLHRAFMRSTKPQRRQILKRLREAERKSR